MSAKRPLIDHLSWHYTADGEWPDDGVRVLLADFQCRYFLVNDWVDDGVAQVLHPCDQCTIDTKEVMAWTRLS